MQTNMRKTVVVATALLLCSVVQSASAAIALDRTRVIFDGSAKSVSLSISNQNKQLPYLAQGWIEDEHGNKIQSPLVALPPVQRIEPGKSSQIKVQALPNIQQLPQDRESVFYFNLREIPPKSDKPNTLQIALQTRIKLFYRPASIAQDQTQGSVPWQEKLTLSRTGDTYQINNPTPYYVTIVAASHSKQAEVAKNFEPLMIPPQSHKAMHVSAGSLGNAPVLTYINDYGGRPVLMFSCHGSECTVTPEKRT